MEIKTEENKITYNGEEYFKSGTQTMANKDIEGCEYCIVRTYSAGVFAGWWDRSLGIREKGTVKRARRLYYWDGAATLSQLAMEGVTKPENCKFTMEAEHDLTNVIEVIPCTESARENIAKVSIWKK